MGPNWGIVGFDSAVGYGELIWNGADSPNVYGGSNIFASIAEHSITVGKLDYVANNTLLGSDLATASGGFSSVGSVVIGAYLTMS